MSEQHEQLHSESMPPGFPRSGQPADSQITRALHRLLLPCRTVEFHSTDGLLYLDPTEHAVMAAAGASESLQPAEDRIMGK